MNTTDFPEPTDSSSGEDPRRRPTLLKRILMWIVNPLGALARIIFKSQLQKTGPVNTFARLCTSNHLVDLQVIASMMVLIALLVVSGAIVIWYRNSAIMSADRLVTIGGAVLATTLAVLNWTYQTGSKRIGGVDLFACEISAICRVSFVMNFANTCVMWAKKTADVASLCKFTSEEEYTPVYDKCLPDLQPLDVEVVTNVTEFYTYRKTMMDLLRRIAVAKEDKERDGLLIQMIYMQFLMYESARHAIDELVEFEPNKAESLVNILSSELPLYGFLRECYDPGDYRYDRLCLRETQYQKETPRLLKQILAPNNNKNWERAQATAPELKKRYEDMIETIDRLARRPARLAPLELVSAKK
jgi:hypothetical protein